MFSANDRGQRARGRLGWIGETSWLAIGKMGSGASRTERRGQPWSSQHHPIPPRILDRNAHGTNTSRAPSAPTCWAHRHIKKADSSVIVSNALSRSSPYS
jgi:hypothetical protein